ncbi:MAG: acyl transferase [Bacteroidetes bacterium]|nr:MAG: acyl transferase [Bacteroidota bacterium]
MSFSFPASQIFEISGEEQFNDMALKVFQHQHFHNKVYRQFCQALKCPVDSLQHYSQIPFLPIEFFKQHAVICGDSLPELVFTSSGTTGSQTSRHYVRSSEIYHESFTKAFRLFFGNPEEYHILALLPGYLERSGSSLIYMADELIRQSRSLHSGFYLNDLGKLKEKIISLRSDPRKVLLLGVSFALLDMAECFPVQHPGLMVMETGGMKGRRKELVREELHGILNQAFGTDKIFSEYGMTELLSQAYSDGKGLFAAPPWMKILIREPNDPLSVSTANVSGGINVIDLANVYSCSFIATQDLGKIHEDGRFEVSGRFDSSDVRGCNLMIS